MNSYILVYMVEEVNTQGSHYIVVLKTTAYRTNPIPINMVVNKLEVLATHRVLDYLLNPEINLVIWVIQYGYRVSWKWRRRR